MRYPLPHTVQMAPLPTFWRMLRMWTMTVFLQL